MISILILTDNIDEWGRKMRDALNVLRGHRTSNGYHIDNLLFSADIMSDVHGRKRYSHIIIDKPINKDVESIVLRPLISNPVIHTKNSISQE